MKNLKLFNSQADYDNFLLNVTFSTPVPNVSYVEATDDVYYNETLRIRVPNNVIMYKAAAKIPLTNDKKEDGFHTNAFNTTVKSHTFANGIGIIEFNADVTTMGDSSFRGCGFTDIVLPDSVTTIGLSAFSRCLNLTSIIIPSGVTNIGQDAFNNCSGLTNIIIPNSVISIGFRTFENCSSLTSVTIGSGVTSINDGRAFANCSSLISITSLATTAPTITDATFYNVKTGGTLTVPTGSTGYDVWMGTGSGYLGNYNWTKVEQ